MAVSQVQAEKSLPPIDEDVIRSAVEKQIRELVEAGKIVVEDDAPTPLPTAQYKKHYRIDGVQELRVQALDMSVLDLGERPQKHPIPGKFYTFRSGHFLTNDDNAIRQIEWLMAGGAKSADGDATGHWTAIYEDDGLDLFRCQHCDYVTASRNAWRAHLRSQHGQEVK